MRRQLIKGKNFHKLPLDKENKLKEGSWEVIISGRIFSCVFGEEEEVLREEHEDLGRRG